MSNETIDPLSAVANDVTGEANSNQPVSGPAPREMEVSLPGAAGQADNIVGQTHSDSAANFESSRAVQGRLTQRGRDSSGRVAIALLNSISPRAQTLNHSALIT
jgi:hypothetical protein